MYEKSIQLFERAGSETECGCVTVKSTSTLRDLHKLFVVKQFIME